LLLDTFKMLAGMRTEGVLTLTLITAVVLASSSYASFDIVVVV
jgi:hypothetical protein